MGRRLTLVANSEGYGSELELLEAAAMDSVCPGICIRCDFVCSEIEPDARDGWCEHCGENRVASVLVIADLI